MKNNGKAAWRICNYSMTEKGYVIAICEDRDSYYLPGVEHIERNDSLMPWEFEDDEAAAKGAEIDGVKLIYGLQGVEDGVYLDTPQNRAQIAKVKDLAEKGYYFNGDKNKATQEFITDETAIALAGAICYPFGKDDYDKEFEKAKQIEAFSQKLQDLGFEAASKAVDCAFEI